MRGDRDFIFLKDTSCDLDHIAAKLEVSKGTNLHLYNANTATLLDSLKLGASGYSGVMCNTQCRLYSWFLEHWKEGKAQELSDLLTISSWMEHEYYPVSAKYYLQQFEALPSLSSAVQRMQVCFPEWFSLRWPC